MQVGLAEDRRGEGRHPTELTGKSAVLGGSGSPSDLWETPGPRRGDSGELWCGRALGNASRPAPGRRHGAREHAQVPGL